VGARSEAQDVGLDAAKGMQAALSPTKASIDASVPLRPSQ
jgi:hypothetical protein